MANHPVAKHDQDRRDDRREEDSLVMPLAEPGPGEPLVGATSVIGDHIEDGERDPHTIAEEQRIRSAAYEADIGKDLPREREDDSRRAAIEDPRRAQHTPQQNQPHRDAPHQRHTDNPSRR